MELDSIKIHFEQGDLWALNISLAIIMFGVALDIRVSDFRRLLRQPKILLTGILAQFILMPALTFLIVWVAKPMPSIALGLIMVGACPGGNISNFLSKLAKGNAALSVSLTAFATLVAVVTTPLNFYFWGSLYPPVQEILQSVSIDPFELFKLIGLILALPLALGMVMRHFKPYLSDKISKLLKPFSILIFAAFVVIAFAGNFDIFMGHIHYVLFFVIIHNLLAFLLGYTTASIFGLSQNDRRTIAIETGIQNAALGMLLIFQFFDGLGGMMLLAAFWGIWDILAGLILALSWATYKPLAK